MSTQSLPAPDAGVRRHRPEERFNRIGWFFLLPAALLICLMNFYPMAEALVLSLKSGRGTRFHWADPWWTNYQRLFEDEIFRKTLTNTVLYLVVQVPVMLVLALVLASLLNNPKLRWRGLWRTAIFLPCAVGLVSYSLIFRTMFATEGLVNDALMALHLVGAPVNWLGNEQTARIVIILGLLWRWTGYNMIFFLAGLQTVDPQTLEAARVDGANSWHTFWHVTVPQLRPMILLCTIMSTNGTIQLFDESWNLTGGGPAYGSMSMSHYLYEVSFQNNPNFGYASAMSYVILLLVAVLAAVQMKVGDHRD